MSADVETSNLLPCRTVIYCGACGMPPEYCEYGPDFETHCDPWLKKHHPELRGELALKRGHEVSNNNAAAAYDKAKKEKPGQPWTTEERLHAFYEKYEPTKVDSVPSLLEKYAGKEDKLFLALTKKYGPEPKDPYFSDSEDDDDDDDDDEAADHGSDHEEGPTGSKNKRRGAHAKKAGEAVTTKVVVQKQAQKKKRVLTVVKGMETVPGLKLKDASKTFSKTFAGSSSVKDKDIIVQGDHVFELAELIVDKFNVPESAVFLDLDGNVVPLR